MYKSLSFYFSDYILLKKNAEIFSFSERTASCYPIIRKLKCCGLNVYFDKSSSSESSNPRVHKVISEGTEVSQGNVYKRLKITDTSKKIFCHGKKLQKKKMRQTP